MHIDRVYTVDTLDQMLLAGDPEYQQRQHEEMRQAEAQVQLPTNPIRIIRVDDRRSIWFANGSYYIGVRAEADEKPDCADVTFYRRWHVGEKRMELVRYDHPNAARADLQTELLVAELTCEEA